MTAGSRGRRRRPSSKGDRATGGRPAGTGSPGAGSRWLRGRRRWIGRAVLIVLPLLVLGSFELALRLLGAARPEPLMIRVTEGPFDVWQINPRVGLRFFPPEMERIMPRPGFRIFPVAKAPSTLRIFVLGGSTAAGFPFHTHGAFSGFLEDRLTVLRPDLHVEVINCAMTAVNSYTILDFVKELRNYDPDLFFIYAGHNEYYGAFGPASSAGIARSRAVILFLKQLRELRITRLLQRTARTLRPPQPVRGQTVMEAMVGQTGIRRGDSIDQAAVEGFAGNLREIISAAGPVPVVVCEVVSNLRDQPPLGSISDRSLGDAEEEERDQLLEEGRSLLPIVSTVDPSDTDGGPWARALELLDQAVGLDSTFADARYLRGRLLDSGGRLEEARRDYEAAREHDAVPFRAPRAINTAIRRVAAETGAGLIPLESVFRSLARDRIPGNDLFWEHVHPRVRGHQQIAEAILRHLAEDPRWGPAHSWRWERDLSEAGYLELSGVTELDEEAADQRIFHLTHKWPFPEDPGASYGSDRDAAVVDLAAAWVGHKIDLAEAHRRLGRLYLERGEPQAALREYRTVCKIFPVVPGDFARAAEILVQLGAGEAAVPYLEQARRLDPGNSRYRVLLEEVQRGGVSPGP